MERSKEQWQTLDKAEFSSLVDRMVAGGAYQAKVGISPVGWLIMAVVAFIPPVFVLWSGLLYLLLRFGKDEQLLLSNDELHFAVRSWSAYKVLSVKLADIKSLRIKTDATDITSILDRMFGFGTNAAYTEGQMLPVLAASDIRKPGDFVAEWKRRTTAPA